MDLVIDTVATGWNRVLDLYRGQAPIRMATRHGISFDIPGLTVWLKNSRDLTVPETYLYPELIRDYRDRLFAGQRDQSLLYQRHRRWRDSAGGHFDQRERIAALLRQDTHSRSAVFNTWLPEDDLASRFPVSPVGGCFRIIEDSLCLFLTARSVDVWVGFVPELLAFAQFTSELALDVGVRSGAVSYQCWSAHLYEVDYLSYLSGES